MVIIAILIHTHTYIACRERDASLARPHVHSALRHYNSINPVTADRFTKSSATLACF